MFSLSNMNSEPIWANYKTDRIVACTGSFFIAIFSGAVSIFYYINSYPQVTMYISSILFIISISSITIFNFIKNSYSIQNYITIIMALTLIATSAINSGGLNRPIIFWVIIIPGISGMILGKKGIIPSALLTLITVLIVFVIHRLGLSSDTVIRGQHGDLSVIYRAGLGTITLSTIFAYITQLSIKKLNRTTLQINNQIKGISRTVGHDILSSLSIIMSSIEILELEKDLIPKQDRDKIKKLKYRADDIYDIVSSVKKIQSIESGKIAVRVEKIDLFKCITEVVEQLSDRYKNKNIHFTIDDSLSKLPKLPIDIKPLKESILKAVISNAIKFSYPNGTVIVSSSIAEDFAYLTVKDNGIGIPKDISKNIFLPSATISRQGTAGEIGAGLALFITKEYMHFYGGDITFETRASGENLEKSGTNFTLKFSTS